MNKNFFLLALLLLHFTFDLKALSDESVNIYSAVAGISAATAGVLVGVNSDRMTTGIIGGLAGGALTSFLVYKYLKKYHTPQGRYDNAIDLIDEIKDDFIFSRKDITSTELIKYINASWPGSWPLVSSRENFVFIQSRLKDELRSIDKAINELKKNRNDQFLLDECSSVRILILHYLDIIVDRISFVVEHKDYNFQMSMFHESQERQKDRNEHALQSGLNRWSNEKIASRPIDLNIYNR